MSAITTVDCHYVLPQFAAAFLLIEGDRAAFIETNTSRARPHLLAALAAAGLSPEQVDHVIITHVHLDHAGGASALMESCPAATLLAHPRAAPHAIDPSRLVASARKVYGDEAFDQLYGQINPIAADRVRTFQDNETLTWGARTLRFLHTRGHANHHFCILDEREEAIFTGDAFGLCFPALQAGGLFVFPSTSPTDFDPDEARKSVRRIVETGARRAFLTHFGEVTDLAGAASQLIAHLDRAEQLRDGAAASDQPDAALDAWVLPQLRAHFEASLAARGLSLGGEIAEVLRVDLDLNSQGIAHAARKKRAGKAA
jgi:glyoxylase-like metal-dependent hydrolase (beta-lactamase superfamily II)